MVITVPDEIAAVLQRVADERGISAEQVAVEELGRLRSGGGGNSAGRDGWAISMCDPTQRAWLRDIEKEIGQPVTVFADHPYHSEAARLSTQRPPVLGSGGRGQGQGRGRPANTGRSHGGGQGGRPRRAA